MRYQILLLVIFCVAAGSLGAFGDLYVNVYYDLKADYPTFVQGLEAEGATQQDIEGFLMALGETVAGYGELTEDNFDAMMYRGLKEVLFIDGDMGMIRHEHRDFALALIGGFSDEIIETLDTKQLSGELASLNQGVKDLLLGDGRQVLYPSKTEQVETQEQVYDLEAFDLEGILKDLQALEASPALVTLVTDSNRFRVPEIGPLFTGVLGVEVVTPVGKVLFREGFAADHRLISLEALSPSRFVFEMEGKPDDGRFDSPPVEVSLAYALKSYQTPGRLTVFSVGEESPRNLGGHYQEPYMTFFTRDSGEFAVQQHPAAFSDLESHDYAKEKILSLAARGIVNGRGEGRFDPSASITRAEFAALSVRMLQVGEAGDLPEFEDVKKTDWFYAEVMRGRASGLFMGRGEGIFDPQGAVSVEEVLTVLTRVLYTRGYPEVDFDLLGGFDASTVSPWARETIATGIRYSLIEDLPRTALRFDEAADRAMVASMVYELLGRILGQ
ncbi:MAG: hypothetical protein AVO33_06020 [delta proteobacterium ML8_F1]|nr:MAG: hypothetical protein AVO33_06020 [delta proteobacterium ML8_F1]